MLGAEQTTELVSRYRLHDGCELLFLAQLMFFRGFDQTSAHLPAE
jgi:hypothetical protein